MYIDGEWRPAAGPDDDRGRATRPTSRSSPRSRRAPQRTSTRPYGPPAPPSPAGPPPRPPSAPPGSARCATCWPPARTRSPRPSPPSSARRSRFSQAVHAGVPDRGRAARTPKLAASYAFEEKIGNSTVLHEPVGVVGAITPWNYPLHQIVAKVAPALAAGCTVVLKPAEDTPLTAQLFAEAVHEAGLPAGVFNLVTGLGPVAGQALAAHDGRRPGLLHRLDRRRPADRRDGGRRRQARRPGTGRQVRQRHPARAPTWPRPSTSASPTSWPTPARRAAPGPGCWCTRDQYDEAVAARRRGRRRSTCRATRGRGTRIGPVVNAKQRDRVRGYIEQGRRGGRAPRRGRPRGARRRDRATTSARPSSPTSPRR